MIFCNVPASPMGNVTRRSWTPSEKHVARKVFKENLEKFKLPSLNDCQQAILVNEELKKRSPAQLKTWLHNQLTKEKDSHSLEGELNYILLYYYFFGLFEFFTAL